MNVTNEKLYEVGSEIDSEQPEFLDKMRADNSAFLNDMKAKDAAFLEEMRVQNAALLEEQSKFRKEMREECSKFRSEIFKWGVTLFIGGTVVMTSVVGVLVVVL